jgi:hypothetical protein
VRFEPLFLALALVAAVACEQVTDCYFFRGLRVRAAVAVAAGGGKTRTSPDRDGRRATPSLCRARPALLGLLDGATATGGAEFWRGGKPNIRQHSKEE